MIRYSLVDMICIAFISSVFTLVIGSHTVKAQDARIQQHFLIDTIIQLPIPYDFDVSYNDVALIEDDYVYVPTTNDSEDKAGLLRFSLDTYVADTLWISSQSADSAEALAVVQAVAKRGSVFALLTQRAVHLLRQSESRLDQYQVIPLTEPWSNVGFLSDSTLVVYEYYYRPGKIGAADSRVQIIQIDGSLGERFSFPSSNGVALTLLNPNQFVQYDHSCFYFLDPLTGAVYRRYHGSEWCQLVEGRIISETAKSFVDFVTAAASREPSQGVVRAVVDSLLLLSQTPGSEWSEYMLLDTTHGVIWVADKRVDSTGIAVNRWRLIRNAYTYPGTSASFVDRGYEADVLCQQSTFPFLGVLQACQLTKGKAVSVGIRSPMHVAYQEGVALPTLLQHEQEYFRSNAPSVSLTIYRYSIDSESADTVVVHVNSLMCSACFSSIVEYLCHHRVPFAVGVENENAVLAHAFKQRLTRQHPECPHGGFRFVQVAQDVMSDRKHPYVTLLRGAKGSENIVFSYDQLFDAKGRFSGFRR